MARVVQELQEQTEYVATRWYRAPEVILSWKHYTQKIDIWSIGCIFAELIGRKPIFQGKDYINQINRIAEIIGTPSKDDILHIGNEEALTFITSLGFKPKIPFQRIFPQAPPEAIDLLERMLMFDPIKRISVEGALAHPFLRTLHDPADEPNAPAVFNFEFENYNLSKEVYRELIYREIMYFHPEIASQLMQQRLPFQNVGNHDGHPGAFG